MTAHIVTTLKNIIGAGLADHQKQALLAFITKRKKLKPLERTEIDATLPQEYLEEAQRSKLFAFWLVAARIAQDRPFYFWIGLTLLAFSLSHAMVNSIVSLF